ncbi:wax synthase-like protein [Arabidopsis thaliana]|uniref:Probable long-chain-alcohol O-fatty-acyltransferase 6 n=2 Tax=Arabidopsis thaliana TaxID=3702 RepID=WAXS6_ARATH|nr:MBOAT (membrane bound O-acyl transferase) family protein [Arabidopsis thaliana]Q9FJ77.1 RecName: Full=Probable long-chain-alcohol O-fatty-acyltransferase 6; AltName: Full=Wax synthase 6 [Arabidopsis thaliana]ABE66250.1 membrane bound O-acyl transferase family protein/wax synthase-like [Arabidopsis thaliana]AED96617.1 MBOAT (membrane bound O-acyl transferase) family protein [Arabidopsis thaliana]CAA0409968.1 unnamed protein product [Arabidopsis thaliana]BAB08550.1 wax synthase-like protein [|eukprot:NP_200344.1 MBOAT (membrane bound O-acyl transferase) family protein [Arabidopsis thaliana]
MEEELKLFIQVWVSAIISVTYCYYLTPKIKTSLLRLLSVLPVCVLFLIIPIFFSTVHSSFTIAFFLSGLAVPKLILFALEKGPLFPLPPNLPHFVCFACFPIKLQKKPNPENTNHFPKWVFALKVFIFGALLLQAYHYKQFLSTNFLLGLYALHIYLELEISLTLIKFLVSITLGCDLEPQFNEPYLATSLHDFWGHRWNLMVSKILWLAVYNPIRQWRAKSSEWDRFFAIFATFLVSGVAHEILYFYLTREKPTWEVTWFFVLHGFCMAAEVALKRKTKLVQRWPVNPAVSRLLTVGFVFVTGVWLFSPQPIRHGLMERFINEDLFLIDFFNRKLYILLGLFTSL